MPANGSQLLSDYAGRKIVIVCDCGKSGRYDADAMFNRIGETKLTELIDRLAHALECPKAGPHLTSGDIRGNRCNLRYDIRQMRGYSSPR